MIFPFVRFSAFMTALALAAGCGDSGSSTNKDDSDNSAGGMDGAPAWVCIEELDYLNNEVTCTCQPPKDSCRGNNDEGSECIDLGAIGPEDGNVIACEYFPCCVRWREGGDRCACTNDATTCELRAAELQDGKVVSACPASAEVAAPSVCAEGGERCQARVESIQDDACCPGLICAAGAEGLTKCREPADGDAEAAAMCERSLRHDQEHFVARGPLTTNLGNLTFPNEGRSLASATFSPTGCVASVRMDLGGLTGACSLSIEAGPARDDEGRLKVTRLVLDATDCGAAVDETFILADIKDGATIPATVDVQGLTCSASITNDRYCAAGVLEVRFAGPVMENGFSDGSVTLDGPFLIDFAVCGEGDSALTCP